MVMEDESGGARVSSRPHVISFSLSLVSSPLLLSLSPFEKQEMFTFHMCTAYFVSETTTEAPGNPWVYVKTNNETTLFI